MNIFNRNVLVAILLCTFAKTPPVALGMEKQQQTWLDPSKKTSTLDTDAISEKLSLSSLREAIRLNDAQKFQFRSLTVRGMINEITEVFNRFSALDSIAGPRFMSRYSLYEEVSSVKTLYLELEFVEQSLSDIRVSSSEKRSELYKRICAVNKETDIVSQEKLQDLANDVWRALGRCMILDDRTKLIEKSVLRCLLRDGKKKGSSVEKTTLFQPLLLDQYDVAPVFADQSDKLQQLKSLVVESAARLQLSIAAIKDCHKEVYATRLSQQDSAVLRSEGLFDDLFDECAVLRKKEQELLWKIERLGTYSNAIRDSDIYTEEQLLDALGEKLDSLHYEAGVTRAEVQVMLDDAKLLKEKIARAVEKAKKQKEDRDIATAIKQEMETAEKQMKQKELNKKVNAFVGKITGFFSQQATGSTPH